MARIKRDADVAAAEADRDTAIKRAEAHARVGGRQGAGGSGAGAGRDAVAGEAGRGDSAISRSSEANYLETVKKQQAQADKAYEIQTNVMQQQVVAESVRVQQIEREQQIKVQEAEIVRREKELIATVLKPAEIERQRIAVLAEAEKSRLSTEAEGRARRRPGCSGEAEADIIFKKGDAEARAMNVKAEAFQEYNQAAVIDKLLTAMPEIVARAGGAARAGGQDHDRLDRQRRVDRACTRSPAT